MTNLSYSIDKLWPKVWHGQKRQSMRATTAFDPKTQAVIHKPQWKKLGDHLAQHKLEYLDVGWKLRSQTGYKLFIAELQSVDVVALGSLSITDWKNDGFEKAEEGFLWFSKTYPYFKLINDNKIESFEIAMLKYLPGGCSHCTYQKFCLKFFESHPEQGRYHIYWENSTPLCPAFFPRIRKSPWNTPRFLDLASITAIPSKPKMAVEAWVMRNCNHCEQCHQVVPGVGVVFDHRTNAWCAADTDRENYADDMQETDLSYFIKGHKLHQDVCDALTEGNPEEEVYGNEFTEEEEDLW
jgi:hypothetical protein